MINDSVRVDKWLWAARFFKTRSQATLAVAAGRVRIHGERIKPARCAKPGEVLEIDNGATRWEVCIRALADKRGSATVAQTLYAETASSIKRREQEKDERHVFREPAQAIRGRPTKRDRRLLDGTRQ